MAAIRWRASFCETAAGAARGVGATGAPDFATGSGADALDLGLTAWVSMLSHPCEGDGILRSRRPRLHLLKLLRINAGATARSAGPGWPGPPSPYLPAAGSGRGSGPPSQPRSPYPECGCARQTDSRTQPGGC